MRDERVDASPPEAFFEGHPVALAAYRAVMSAVATHGPIEVRVSRSQVALRSRRGFAYLWLPGRWLRNPTAELGLSIALERHVESPRFKEVAHPAAAVWMHHLEVTSEADVDGEVAGWLREAADQAR